MVAVPKTKSAASGRLRHFLFTWLKTHGIDDALIQPYSGHASRTSLEIYSKITLGPAQDTYDSVIDQFPVLDALTVLTGPSLPAPPGGLHVGRWPRS